MITAGGYREPITLQQIRTNMEMESHEEKLHNMIKISKMESAKDQARDAARTIKERQRDQQRLGLVSSMAGIGGGGMTDSPSPPSSSGSLANFQAHLLFLIRSFSIFLQTGPYSNPELTRVLPLCLPLVALRVFLLPAHLLLL